MGHAKAYPSIWYGIWTAPDGMWGPEGDSPGQAWFSQVTPMTDFPAQNNNAHVMALLAVLRVAGVEATATGLRLAPAVPSRRFALRTALLDLDQDGPRVDAVYRPLGGPRTVVVHAPAGEHVLSAEVAGAPVAVPPGSESIELAIMSAGPGAETKLVVQTEKN